MLMAYEVTRDLPLKEIEIETPVAPCKTHVLAGKKLGIVPILRAGLGMVDGVTNLVPAAKVGHIGLYRDPETHLPVEYYCKLPPDVGEREMLVLDPMLATGGSSIAAIDILKKHGCNSIKLVCLVGCPEGVEALAEGASRRRSLHRRHRRPPQRAQVHRPRPRRRGRPSLRHEIVPAGSLRKLRGF